MSTAGVSSSSRALASSIAREQESFISFRLRTKGDIIQKRANESVYTAAGTNLIEINDIEQTIHAPSSGDMNQMRWRSTQVEFNVYILRLTDLDDELIEEQFTALGIPPEPDQR